MKLTGHMSAEMNKGYTHHELEPLRAAIGLNAVAFRQEIRSPAVKGDSAKRRVCGILAKYSKDSSAAIFADQLLQEGI